MSSSIRTEPQQLQAPVSPSHTESKAQQALRWCPLAATTAQVVPCAFLVALSGYRAVIGGLAVFSASIAGPFEVFHRNSIRIPFFAIAGALALLNLYMYWYARSRREARGAQWRRPPISARERRVQKIQIFSSILTLCMIAGDILSHHINGIHS